MKRKIFLSTLTLSLIKVDLLAFEKPEKCVIHTNKVCERCKYNIGRNIAFEKGVKDVIVDIAQQKFTIIYDPSKTNPEKIKKYIISKGFDADDLKANMKKREIYLDCCFSDITICK